MDSVKSRELLTYERELQCCCYQEMSVTSGNEEIGFLKEDYYYCVPQFSVYGPGGSDKLYSKCLEQVVTRKIP